MRHFILGGVVKPTISFNRALVVPHYTTTNQYIFCFISQFMYNIEIKFSIPCAIIKTRKIYQIHNKKIIMSIYIFLFLNFCK